VGLESPTSEVALREVAALVCHEFNNALNGIVLQVAVLEQTLPAESRAELEVIRRLARGAAELIKKLQDHNRQAPPAAESIDLTVFLREIADTLEEHVGGAKIQLDIDAEPACVAAPAPILERVLWLLAQHAATISAPNPPRIRLRTQKNNERGLIRWENRGPGVTDEQIEQVFDVGRSEDMTLPVCRLLVRRFGGSIRAEKSSEGALAFTIELPLAARP
jgi:signal transduction histidine kinase